MEITEEQKRLIGRELWRHELLDYDFVEGKVFVFTEKHNPELPESIEGVPVQEIVIHCQYTLKKLGYK